MIPDIKWLDHLPGMAFCWRYQQQQLHLVYCSAGCAQLFPFSAQQLHHDESLFWQYYSTGQQLAIRESLQFAIDTQQAWRLRLELPQFSPLQAHQFHGQLVMEPDAVLVFGQLLDVSKEVIHQRQQHQQELLLSSLFELSPIGLVLLDYHRQTILKSNRALQQLLDRSHQELMAVSFEQFVHHDHLSLYRLQRWQARDQQQVQAHELSLIDRHGQQRPVLINGMYLDNDDHGLLWLLIEDMGPRKANEQELISAREEAEQAARIKANFLASMSHEIRTPLNGVLGMLDILKYANLQPEQHQHVELAQQSGLSLLRLLNDILDFSKMEAGKLLLVHEAVHLPDVLLEVFQPIRALAEQQGLSADLLTDWDCLPWVKTDAVRLKQILQNLLSNALKFTEQGFIRLSASLHAQGSDGLLTIEVADSGIGLTNEQQQQLFAPFTQADSSTTRKYGGTGLGLAICKQLCEQMDGGISLSSEWQQGSCVTIWFSLPLAEAQLASAPVNDLSRVQLQGQHALLVDDSEINRHVISLMLTAIGLTVSTANNGAEAIEQLLSSPESTFDLVIMDCMMPVMDGYQATAAIRQGAAGGSQQDIPILALTANAQQGDQDACFAAGMDQYLSKPVDILSLAQTLRRLLGQPAEHTVEVVDAPAVIDSAVLSPTAEPADPGSTAHSHQLWQPQRFRQSLGPMVSAYEQLRQLFINQSTDTGHKLSSAFAAQDDDQLRKLAHGLKGSAQQMFCPLLAEQAKKLEQASLQQNWPEIEALYPRLQQILEQSLQALQRDDT